MRTLAIFRRLYRLGILAAGLIGSVIGQPQAPNLADAKRLSQYDGTVDLLLDDDLLSPATLQLVEGRYRIQIHNAFTQSRLDIRVDDDDKKERVKDDEVKEKAVKSDFVVDLKQGKYRVSVAQRAKWQCIVTVVKKSK